MTIYISYINDNRQKSEKELENIKENQEYGYTFISKNCKLAESLLL